LPIAEAAGTLMDLTSNRHTWAEMLAKYPNVEASAEEKE